MHHLTLPCLRSQALRRAVCLSVLFAVLLLQVQVALAGCLVSAVEPAAVQTMDMPAGCDQRNAPAMRACLQQCEQVSEAPTSSVAYDASDLYVPLLSGRCVPELSLLAEHRTAMSRVGDPPPANGPPVYLRLLRLLN